MQVSVFAPRHRHDIVVVSARAEGPGKILGDFREEIRAGGTFLGWSFEELKALGTGNYDLEPKPGWKPGGAIIAGRKGGRGQRFARSLTLLSRHPRKVAPMKVSLFLPPHLPDVISIAARVENPNGRGLGDFRQQIRPGDTFLGYTYDEIKSMGTGNYDLEPKPGWKPGSDKIAPVGKAGAGNASPAA